MPDCEGEGEGQRGLIACNKDLQLESNQGCYSYAVHWNWSHSMVFYIYINMFPPKSPVHGKHTLVKISQSSNYAYKLNF